MENVKKNVILTCLYFNILIPDSTTVQIINSDTIKNPIFIV